MDFNKLFKLEDEKTLEDMEEVSLRGRENEEIRKIILDNFQKLFPYLELSNEGKEYALPTFKKGSYKKPDSLAFCESEKRLYILEYKSKIDEDLITQTTNYRNFLQKNDEDLCKLVIKWNKQVNKHRDIEEFKNNKAKIICIAPEFDVHAIGVEEKWEEEIYLIKITKYKDKRGNLLVLLQGRYLNDLIFLTNSEENSIREKILRPSGESLAEVKNCILSLGNLEERVREGESYTPRIRFYNKGRELVALTPKNKKVNIYWKFKKPQEISQNLKNLLNKKEYGIHYSELDHGLGKSYWFFEYGQGSLQLLQAFIQEYKDYCRDELKLD